MKKKVREYFFERKEIDIYGSWTESENLAIIKRNRAGMSGDFTAERKRK